MTRRPAPPARAESLAQCSRLLCEELDSLCNNLWGTYMLREKLGVKLRVSCKIRRGGTTKSGVPSTQPDPQVGWKLSRINVHSTRHVVPELLESGRTERLGPNVIEWRA